MIPTRYMMDIVRLPGRTLMVQRSEETETRQGLLAYISQVFQVSEEELAAVTVETKTVTYHF